MTFDPDGTLFVMEWRPDPVTGDQWFEVKETFRYQRRHDAPGRDDEEVHDRPGEGFSYNAAHRQVRQARRSSSPRNCPRASCATMAGCT